MALSRDLASNNIWVDSLERSLARRGRPRRASLELGKLTPPRDLSDPDNLAESALYWRTRRAASQGTTIPAAGGATALALLAATTLPTLTAGHSDGTQTASSAGASRAGSGAGTRTQLVHRIASGRKAFNPSKSSALEIPGATAAQSFGKVIYGSTENVQRMLGLGIDGQVGPATGVAIRQFQTAHGLTANGIVDQTTYDAMQAAYPAVAQAAPVTPTVVTGGGSLAHAASASAPVAATAPVATGSATSGAGTTPAAGADTVVGTGGAVDNTTAGGTTATTTAPDSTTAVSAVDTTAATQPALPQGVSAVQTALHVQADGTFGSQTKAAVETFQANHGLTVDGIVGPQTRSALGLGVGPTLHDTEPPPPPPAPAPSTATTGDTTTSASGSTQQATSSPSTPSSSTTSTPSSTATSTSSGSADATPSTGTPGNAASGMAAMIAAADQIATLPYLWGGGHGSWVSPGYDCSGSVSYVLHAAGLLGVPEDSTALESYGAPGPGRYVTIYANSTHAWMTIDGRRFDTVALSEGGSRWSSGGGEFAGFVVRHPVGY